MKPSQLLLGCAFALTMGQFLAACQQDIDVNLPAYHSKLVLECYLEDGQPVRLSLVESQSYLAAGDNPLVEKATVLLTYQGQQDTIPNVPYVDPATRKTYNYSSVKRIRACYNVPYTLTILDTKGRKVTAVTHFIRSVPITSLPPVFNGKGKPTG